MGIYFLESSIQPLRLTSAAVHTCQWQGSLPSRHFAGYINVHNATGRHLFYYLVHSEVFIFRVWRDFDLTNIDQLTTRRETRQSTLLSFGSMAVPAAQASMAGCTSTAPSSSSMIKPEAASLHN